MTWRDEVYWLLFAAGILLFLALYTRELRKSAVAWKWIVTLYAGVLLSLFVGERASWVIRHWNYYSTEPLYSIFAFWEGGMDSIGGILGCLLWIIVLSIVSRIELDTFLDAGTVGAGWIIGLSRIGCFVVGDDWGTRTSLPWAVTFARDQVAYQEQLAMEWISADAPSSLPVHPVQLYLAAAGFVLAVLFTFVWRNERWRPGRKAGLFLILLGVERFLFEFLRADISRGISYGLSSPQWVMLLLIALGAVLLLVPSGTEEHTMQVV